MFDRNKSPRIAMSKGASSLHTNDITTHDRKPLSKDQNTIFQRLCMEYFYCMVVKLEL